MCVNRFLIYLNDRVFRCALDENNIASDYYLTLLNFHFSFLWTTSSWTWIRSGTTEDDSRTGYQSIAWPVFPPSFVWWENNVGAGCSQVLLIYIDLENLPAGSKYTSSVLFCMSWLHFVAWRSNSLSAINRIQMLFACLLLFGFLAAWISKFMERWSCAQITFSFTLHFSLCALWGKTGSYNKSSNYFLK